ncbi:flavin reductase [Halobacteriovorax sp. BALOs_7]|uniref:NAD(P)H-dependent oxidoreductase n=1 Tax=Halobacteriovorax sp. BALOs_7 TaxID=2109558 RepID=UPI000EB6BBB4|nr:NAD(P)H-dependent oxidoreductase [Halobacteriovorax sp. BALOs_7]AYF43771.1 flavin reductase [Halobacteriovorax sp. BALOs_7]
MKVLIINAHPDLESFTTSISNKIYESHLAKGHDVTLLNLATIDFEISFKGYSDREKIDTLETDLESAQKQIKKSDHIIITTPIWWSTYPAILKGFFDRTLLPGFAFKFHKGKMVQEKLLTGKTAELVLLSDAPAWYRRYLLKDPAATILKRDILGFCGIKVKKVHRIGSVGSLDAEARERVIKTF